MINFYFHFVGDEIQNKNHKEKHIELCEKDILIFI